MILSMALAWAGQSVIFGQLANGAGRHIGDVDPDIYMKGMKLNFISQPIYLIAICVVKLSVGCALLRIASTKFYRWLILSIMGFMAFYTIGCFFVSHSPIFIQLFQTTDILHRRPSYYDVRISASFGTTAYPRRAGRRRHYRVFRTQTLRSTS